MFRSQHLSQRFLTKADWFGPPPGDGTEVFVHKLEQSTALDELYDYFIKIGSIYQIRMPVNLDGSHRGIAFVRFCEPCSALLAVTKPGRKYKVNLSEEKHRVTVNDIDPMKTVKNLDSALSNFEDIKRYSFDKQKYKACLVIDFANHRAAALARRYLMSDNAKKCKEYFGKRSSISWSEGKGSSLSSQKVVAKNSTKSFGPSMDKLEAMAEIRNLHVSSIDLLNASSSGYPYMDTCSKSLTNELKGELKVPFDSSFGNVEPQGFSRPRASVSSLTGLNSEIQSPPFGSLPCPGYNKWTHDTSHVNSFLLPSTAPKEEGFLWNSNLLPFDKMSSELDSELINQAFFGLSGNENLDNWCSRTNNSFDNRSDGSPVAGIFNTNLFSLNAESGTTNTCPMAKVSRVSYGSLGSSSCSTPSCADTSEDACSPVFFSSDCNDKSESHSIFNFDFL